MANYHPILFRRNFFDRRKLERRGQYCVSEKTLHFKFEKEIKLAY